MALTECSEGHRGGRCPLQTCNEGHRGVSIDKEIGDAPQGRQLLRPVAGVTDVKQAEQIMPGRENNNG